VFLWPDFDMFRERLTSDEEAQGVDADSKPLLPIHLQEGALAMMAIAQNLKGITADANIRMVPYTPGEKPHGWDLADAQAEGWTGEDVLKMLAERSHDPREVMTAQVVKPAAAPAGGGGGAEKPADKHAPLAYPVNEFGFPDRGDKGPIDTLENLEYMLAQYGITARYNVISKEVEVSIPGAQFSQDNHMEACLATIGSLCSRNRMPRANVTGYITTLADAIKYNPAADWIDSKPWDGVDRIEPLADTLDPRDAELARLLLRKWMVGAVAAVFEARGFAMQGVIVLLGEQNLGKTTWIKHMAEFDEKLVKEAAVLNTADKDSIKQVVSYWLVELGELEATFSKSDITALRGFITQQVDEIRLPYARASSKFPRRTAFLASVNDRTYLRDETGNRRYWTIDCGPEMNAMHDIDMQQAWAQAKTLYLAGAQHHLSKEDNARLAESNIGYTERNPLEDLIYHRFDWSKPAASKMAAAEVCIQIGYDKPTSKQAKDAATILRKLTGSEPKKSNGRLVFAVPPLQTNRYKDEGFTGDDNTRPF
jgi:putative DNA primase/helicase